MVSTRALVGFVISLTPLSIDLAGWRGTGGAGVGAATTGTYFFFGGLLLILGSVGEVSLHFVVSRLFYLTF